MLASLRQGPDRGAGASELWVHLGRHAAGRVRWRSVSFSGTTRGAQGELTRLVAEQDRAPAVVPDEIFPDETFRAWGPTTINDAIEAGQANGSDELSPKGRGATRPCSG
jgi:hypothetical protein